jgi:hypothetical protein
MPGFELIPLFACAAAVCTENLTASVMLSDQLPFAAVEIVVHGLALSGDP